MRELVLDAPWNLAARDVPEPVPAGDEVLIRVHSVGICGSDIHAFTGEHPFVLYPVVPGHEFSGTIEAAGDLVPEEYVGAAACVEPSFVCGSCRQCLSGRYNICASLRVMGFQAPGAMCEAVCVPLEKVHLLPAGMDMRAGALVEPLAVAVHAFERSGAAEGYPVLVLGTGVIGTMVMQVARARGCRVTCVETDEERRARASKAGADMVFDGNVSPAEITEATGGALAAVFECAGVPAAIDLAVRATPRGATMVVVGVLSEPAPVPLELVQDGELDIRGTLMYMGPDFEEAVGLLASGAVDPTDIITHVVDLEEAERGYRMLLDTDTDTMKVLVEPGG